MQLSKNFVLVLALILPGRAWASVQEIVSGPSAVLNGSADRVCSFGSLCDSTHPANTTFPTAAMPVAGTIKNLRAHYSLGVTGAFTDVFTLYKNGGATSLTCTITGGSSVCSDLVHSVSVSAGDYLIWDVNGNGAGNGNPNIVVDFVPNTNNDTALFSWVSASAWSNSSENGIPLSQASPGTINFRKTAYIPEAGTFSNLYSYISTAPGVGASMAFAGNKNGTDQALTCTISGASLACNDPGDSFTVADGDTVLFSMTPSGTPVVTGDNGLGVRYVPNTPGDFVMLLSGVSNGESDTTSTFYYPLSSAIKTTSEADTQAPMNNCLVTKLEIHVSNAPVAGKSRTFTIRQNGADTSAACVVSAGATSCSWAGVLQIDDGDLMDVSDVPFNNAGTSTNVSVSIVAHRVDHDAFINAGVISNGIINAH